MTNTWLNDSAPKQLFKDKDLQLLMFHKRMKFTSPDGRPNNKITFSSSYYCYFFTQTNYQLLMNPITMKTTSKTVHHPLRCPLLMDYLIEVPREPTQ